MAAIPATQDVSFESYLEQDEASPDRLESFRGLVFTMMAASGNHVAIQANLARRCGNALAGKGCRFYGENAKVRVERSGSGYHPDGTIACPPGFSNERGGVVKSPQVVFEILSPSTERFDRRDKLDDYALVPTIQEIVLIETEAARIEVYERREEGWLRRVYLAGTAALIPSVGIELPLDELYEDVAFEEAPSKAS